MGSALTMYAKGLDSNIALANGYIPAPFIDNHDMNRFTPSIDDLADTKYQYALLTMLNGTTFTYYGSEVGMVGENASSKLGINITNHSRLCIETVIVSCFAKSFASIF